MELGTIKKQKIDAILRQERMKHCCPMELLGEIMFEEKAAEDLKPEIKRLYGKKRKND